jgi:hypothetical protein
MVACLQGHGGVAMTSASIPREAEALTLVIRSAASGETLLGILRSTFRILLYVAGKSA